jgi:enamine deaminase RidA (YjgF/YER057c/UK114 family)
MVKKEIQAKGVPAAAGLFSRGITVSNPKKLIFLSGLCSHKGKGIREQTLEIYRNMTKLLKEADASWDNVAKILFFMKDFERDYEEFSKAREDFFKEMEIEPPYPASTGVQAKLIRDDFLIEIEVTAVID